MKRIFVVKGSDGENKNRRLLAEKGLLANEAGKGKVFEILFCMRYLTEKQFMHLPGVERMIRKFADTGWLWEYFDLEKMAEENKDSPAENPTDAEQMIVTDSYRLAQQAKAAGICCVGYQEEDDLRYFPGVEYVVNSFEELDTTFFANALRRFHGLTAVIAETERLVIRESCEEDFPALYRISRENESRCCVEGMSGDYEEEKAKFLSYIGCAYNYFGYGLWTVLERETETVIGRCGLNPVTDELSPQGRIELGYLIGKDYQRKGYAWEACRKILEYGFKTLDCSVLYALIHKENAPSRALTRKLGFQKEKLGETEQEIELWRKNRSA
ncbi:MAG: GNAT family N-acetyltransferase [Lachnospiraceae bacterium]|nr:GNAT family N-acetyltransferase [Lachnospiraceae bacterium]